MKYFYALTDLEPYNPSGFTKYDKNLGGLILFETCNVFFLG